MVSSALPCGGRASVMVSSALPCGGTSSVEGYTRSASHEALRRTSRRAGVNQAEAACCCDSSQLAPADGSCSSAWTCFEHAHACALRECARYISG